MSWPTAKRRIVETTVLMGAVVVLAPVVLMVLTSFKPDAETIHFKSMLPMEWTLENYREVLGNPEEIPLLGWFSF